jgi:hypothetical protein
MKAKLLVTSYIRVDITTPTEHIIKNLLSRISNHQKQEIS